MRHRFLALATFVLALGPAAAWADNTSAVDAYSIAVGQTPVETEVSVTGPLERWYKTRVFPGRSYCAETAGGVFFDTSGLAGIIDTIVTIYADDATTVIALNDDTNSATSDPSGVGLSRACFRSALAVNALIYIKVSAFAGGFLTRMRFVETTRFSNWFFTAGDYNAFTILRNTTNAILAYTIAWRDAGGTLVGTTSGTLPPNGNAAINSKLFTGATTAGSVQVAHDGSLNALMATTTVLSMSTGLSFDTIFEARQPW